MRAFVYGLLGGLVALLIGGAVVAAVLIGRERAAQDNRRAVLLRQLDDLQQWGKTHPQAAFPSNQWGAATTRDYERFLAQRRELEAYLAWTIETRRAEGGRGFMATYRAEKPSLAELRDPAWMARYFAQKR